MERKLNIYRGRPPKSKASIRNLIKTGSLRICQFLVSHTLFKSRIINNKTITAQESLISIDLESKVFLQHHILANIGNSHRNCFSILKNAIHVPCSTCFLWQLKVFANSGFQHVDSRWLQNISNQSSIQGRRVFYIISFKRGRYSRSIIVPFNFIFPILDIKSHCRARDLRKHHNMISSNTESVGLFKLKLVQLCTSGNCLGNPSRHTIISHQQIIGVNVAGTLDCAVVEHKQSVAEKHAFSQNNPSHVGKYVPLKSVCSRIPSTPPSA